MLLPTVTSVMWHPTPELRARWLRQYGRDRFTFEEALQAQSFPAGWLFPEGKVKRWKWLGEAFPPKVAEHLFRSHLSGSGYVLLDLFAGIGGWSLGGVWSGRFRKVVMVDWDPEKCRYLKSNFSRLQVGVEFEVLCMDVRRLVNVEADVVATSPPCEDMTVLKYFNFNKTSAGTVPLTTFTARFVEKVKPLTAFYENVWRIGLAELLEDFGWRVERFDMSGIIPQRRVRLLAVYNCRRTLEDFAGKDL